MWRWPLCCHSTSCSSHSDRCSPCSGSTGCCDLTRCAPRARVPPAVVLWPAPSWLKVWNRPWRLTARASAYSVLLQIFDVIADLYYSVTSLQLKTSPNYSMVRCCRAYSNRKRHVVAMVIKMACVVWLLRPACGPLDASVTLSPSVRTHHTPHATFYIAGSNQPARLPLPRGCALHRVHRRAPGGAFAR